MHLNSRGELGRRLKNLRICSLKKVTDYEQNKSYLLLKSPRFHDFINSAHARGLKIFCGGSWPAE
jgi:hypothetical protein